MNLSTNSLRLPLQALRRSLVWSPVLALLLPASLSSQTPAAPAAPAAAEEDVFELSPFEVTADATGYFQANSMSGTRLNSKVEDLAQSITVMTKDQMSDFAMLDINDVFDHMASTEGTGSYSLFETDRTGAVVDQVSLDPNNANRVRGIGNANIAFNNIATTGRVPVDPLWLDSLELSRGPNANIFGLGNASGTVNQVPATASLNRDFTKVQLRVDSYDGHRASVDVNRMLTDTFAVRVSYADQHTGFIRKPSGEDTRRISLQAKAKPFENTTFALSWYNYENEAVRPNFTTPRDYYTGWIAAGKPGWNPITGLVTLENGDVYGRNNVLGSTTPYTSTPSFFSGPENRSVFRIGDSDETPYWAMPRYTSGALATSDPFGATATGVGLLNTGPSESYTATQQPLFNSVVRPISDKSIYDWTKINLAGNSKAWDDTDIFMAQVDQIILNSTKHTLAFQATFMREDVERLENQPMGPASVNSNVGQLQVDVNQYNLDGTANPYFGRPYLRSNEPFLRDRSLVWDTYRAQGVYRLNFAQDDGWTKWLGTQQVLGYYEYKNQQNRIYTYRHSALGLDKPWQQKYADLNTPLGNRTSANVDPRYPIAPGNYARVNEQYYVGGSFGSGIEYAPNYFPEGVSLPYVWGPTSSTMNQDVSGIGWTPSPDGGGGGANVQSVIKTMGGVLQSSFFGNKLVGTFGLREDRVFDRNAPFATLTENLREYDFASSNQWNEGWREAEGKTENISIVARPFQDIEFLKSQAKGGSGFGRFLAEAVNGLSLTYNKADNFIAQGPAFDLFLNRLPNQTGTTKDLGLWMTVLEGKLSLRYVHYETKQLNLRNGDISTMAQRVMRPDGLVANDRWNLEKHVTAWLGGTPTAAQIADAMQMPLEQYNGLNAIVANNTYAAVNDMASEGDELEINFNPNENWTVSASVTKTESINTAAGSAVDDYIAARMPIWTTIEDPRFTAADDPNAGTANAIPTGATGHLLWWHIRGAPFTTLGDYDANNSAATNFAANVDAPMSVFRAMVGRPRPQVRKYSAKFSTKYDLEGMSDHKVLKNMSIGGSLRWTDEASIGFYGLGYDPSLDLRLAANKILQLDTNRPIFSPSETYVDLFVNYKTKLFDDKVRANFQLNVKNAFEDGGGLLATSAFLDGTPSTYRIIDPRQFVFTVSLDM